MNHVSKIQKGAIGEEVAVSYLKRKGYKILEKNFRCPVGEIDIIARDQDDLVFIEVKTRTSGVMGYPEEAVNLQKQRKIIHAALHYLQKRNLSDEKIRFDVMAIMMTSSFPEITLIPNAFTYDES